MNNIAVLTSGREAAGMNAAIRAVVRTAVFHGMQVCGVQNGFHGLDGDFVPMSLSAVGDALHRGGTMLLSSLFGGYADEASMRRAVDGLTKANIDGLIVVGDADGLRGASQLSTLGFPVLGIPASAENDIPGTDYCIGFDTAVNTAVEAIDRIRDTASSHARTYVIEVLGQYSSDMAIRVGMCVGADAILLPGMEFNLDEMIDKIGQGFERGKTHSIIVVPEGYKGKIDIVNEIGNKSWLEIKLTILGQLQRGGSPSAYDRMVSSWMGAQSVDMLRSGETGVMIAMSRGELVVAPLPQTAKTWKSSDAAMFERVKKLTF